MGAIYATVDGVAAMTEWPWCAAIAAGLAVLAAWRPRAVLRLRPRAIHDANASGGEGVGVLIASVQGRLRSGSTVFEALERYMGCPFATRAITLPRMRAVLWRARIRDETARQVETMAFAFTAACRLSERSGCEMARCLDVVAEDHHRLRMMENLRRNAFAMPAATVRLLSALPFVTVALGMLLGADPMGFLFDSVGGLACLGIGLACYLIGLLWLRMLFDEAENP